MAARENSGAIALLVVAAIVSACSRAAEAGAGSKSAPEAPAARMAAAPAPAPNAATDTAPAERRIVKKASLSLEVAAPNDALTKVTRLVEREGGFVATTERAQQADEGHKSAARIALTLRVPADRFTSVLEELRRLGTGNGSESITTDDVSEEFIDLDARIKNQRELEAQFLQILKQATKVEEALHVQREIAGVRTEIDRMEGRRRFLERETALSTISLELTAPEPLVRASFRDFGTAITRASSDTLNVGAGIVTASIRLLGIALPLALLVGVPIALIIRFGVRRTRRPARAPDAV